MECNINFLLITTVGLVQDQTKFVASEKCVDIAVTIEHFEDRFRSLNKEILRQLVASDISTFTVLHSLTLLPTKVVKEYKEDMKEIMPSLEKKKNYTRAFPST